MTPTDRRRGQRGDASRDSLVDAFAAAGGAALSGSRVAASRHTAQHYAAQAGHVSPARRRHARHHTPDPGGVAQLAVRRANTRRHLQRDERTRSQFHAAAKHGRVIESLYNKIMNSIRLETHMITIKPIIQLPQRLCIPYSQVNHIPR